MLESLCCCSDSWLKHLFWGNCLRDGTYPTQLLLHSMPRAKECSSYGAYNLSQSYKEDYFWTLNSCQTHFSKKKFDLMPHHVIWTPVCLPLTPFFLSHYSPSDLFYLPFQPPPHSVTHSIPHITLPLIPDLSPSPTLFSRQSQNHFINSPWFKHIPNQNSLLVGVMHKPLSL